MKLEDALKFEENKLEELKEDLEKHKRVLREDFDNFFTNHHKSQVILVSEMIEQKTIVVESMKLVQKQTHSYPQGIVFANRWLTQEEIDALGLREEVEQ